MKDGIISPSTLPRDRAVKIYYKNLNWNLNKYVQISNTEISLMIGPSDQPQPALAVLLKIGNPKHRIWSGLVVQIFWCCSSKMSSHFLAGGNPMILGWRLSLDILILSRRTSTIISWGSSYNNLPISILAPRKPKIDEHFKCKLFIANLQCTIILNYTCNFCYKAGTEFNI